MTDSFTVDTHPTKTVVVQSLTGDATVEECVLDLIDNSIDGARNTIFRDEQATPNEGLPESYSGYAIDIKLKAVAFRYPIIAGGSQLILCRIQPYDLGNPLSTNSELVYMGSA
jgi:hypothetical protein